MFIRKKVYLEILAKEREKTAELLIEVERLKAENAKLATECNQLAETHVDDAAKLALAQDELSTIRRELNALRAEKQKRSDNARKAAQARYNKKKS